MDLFKAITSITVSLTMAGIVAVASFLWLAIKALCKKKKRGKK
jgi:hypothetical protein